MNGEVVVGSAALVVSASSGSMTYGGSSPDHHGVVLGLRERRQRGVAHHGAHVLDHGHVLQPGGQLRRLVHGGRRRQLHHHLRGWLGHGRPRTAVGHGLLGVHDLRRRRPTITPTYAGFVNGDDASSLTTAPTCSTTATSSSPVGSYPSSCSGAVDANYTISYVGRDRAGEPGTAVDHGLLGARPPTGALCRPSPPAYSGS